jgi:pimeloyl-ACP methyl ester carboxylesterase
VVRIVSFLIALLVPFSAVVLFMAWSQDDFIFPVHAVGPPPALPPGGERMQVATPDRQTLHGVHIPPSRSADTKLLVIGFGGNAWNGEDVAAYLHDLYPDAHVVAFHYRGYRPSTGKPSAEALLRDAPLIFDAAVKKVQPDRTIVVGFSIGSGLAASLANRRPAAGLILVTPFDSLKKVAGSLYPWLPVGLFFHHEIDAAEALSGSEVPVVIIGAERDEIIPRARTAALRDVTPNLLMHRTIRGAGHNDIYQRSEFQDAMREAADAIVGRSN